MVIVHEVFLKWIGLYLSKCKFHATIIEVQSDIRSTMSGVPQGSHLGPSFFLIYISDIGECFHFCEDLIICG